jgi:deoxyribodipyrimidine photolyase-related protein
MGAHLGRRQVLLRPLPRGGTEGAAMSAPLRHLVLVLGDQLWLGNPALEGFDPAHDRVLMIEAPGEGTAVWSHKARIALFLSAMRHFCNEVHRQGWPYTYVRLDEQPELLSFQERLTQALRGLQPEMLRVCEPGEWRMLAAVQDAASAVGVPLQVLPDSHFMCTRDAFARWAGDKKELRMEFFYREMRRRHGVLMQGREPEGGQWNFDADNRKGYPASGPGEIPAPAWFEPDRITRQVFELVEQYFAGHPGSLASFQWPVTREQALQALQRFIDLRLPRFGPQQDAMWTNTPWGWHALLATSLNLHLLDPREVIAAAEAAYRERGLELASVEGFIRQILGWREFIRGVYWLDMPQMKDANHFNHQRALPAWYWTGRTRMACMRDVVGQTLAHGHAHHIQRLMVTGQFAVLAEIRPQAVSDWYLAVYVDAVEWVELPNTAGMALFANGGRFTSKPYIASGQYIKRMSNYCKGCAYNPEQKTGDTACPMTTLYWNFLDRHEDSLMKNPRTVLMARNIGRLSGEERESIRRQAAYTLSNLDDL